MPEGSSYAVVIVTWNHVRTLPSCLAAVARLHPPPRQVVVIDNASTDGTADAAAQATVPGLSLVREQQNTGFAAAVNRALAITTTPWVLVLNPDCAPRPDFVAELLSMKDRIRQSHRVGALTGKLLRATGDDLVAGPLIDAAGMVVTPAGRHLDRGAGQPDNGSFDRPALVFGGTGAACLYRRTALADVAYPDGEVLASCFFAFREDAELAWRLQWRGWHCLYVPTAVASHQRGQRPESGRAGHQVANFHSVRNRFLLRAHCADLAWHLRCFPWWLLRDLLVVVACLTVERRSLPALAEAWRLRRQARVKRRWVLDRATVPSRQVRRWFRRRGRVEELSP